MPVPPLTDLQKERLGRLEPQLRKAVLNGNLQIAKQITLDIQSILRQSGHQTRLMQAKSWLYEAAMEAGDYSFAVEGLKVIRLKISKNTRLYLEASALLAICYIRMNDLEKARPIVVEVLKNDKVIRSQTKREIFHKLIIERFDEEVILSFLKGVGNETLDQENVQILAVRQLENSTENQLYYLIGNSVPENIVQSLRLMNDFSKRQLPPAEQLKLPSSNEEVRQDKVGKTVFSSVKRTLYKSLCDPESEVYKAWFNEGLKSLLNKKYITYAVVAAMSGLGIGITAIAASIVALIIKFGIEIYCTHNKPTGVMELR